MTPIYDKTHTEWTQAIASGEARAMLQMKKRILNALQEIHRPTQKVKAIIKELESIK
jgi:hypothetical protein